VNTWKDLLEAARKATSTLTAAKIVAERNNPGTASPVLRNAVAVEERLRVSAYWLSYLVTAWARDGPDGLARSYLQRLLGQAERAVSELKQSATAAG
jgi:hypothetical protein